MRTNSRALRLRGFDGELQASLAQSEMLKYHFRNAAQTGLMVYRSFFDQIADESWLVCGGDLQRSPRT
jgi:hypothetical protein